MDHSEKVIDHSEKVIDHSVTSETSSDSIYDELSIEEKFTVLSSNTPIKYLDTHQTAISGPLIKF